MTRRGVPVLTALLVAVLAAGIGAVVTGAAAERGGPACPPSHVSTGRFPSLPAGAPVELAASCLADHGVLPAAGGLRPEEPATARDVAGALRRLADRAGVAAPALPGGEVTRSRLAAALAGLLRSTGSLPAGPHPDAFDDDERDPHEADVDALAAAGLVEDPAPHRLFSPDAPVTEGDLALALADALALLVDQGRVDSAYPDARPVQARLAQDGRLLQPGEELTGTATGDGVTGIELDAPCLAGAASTSSRAGGVRFTAATDRQAPVGRCPVDVRVDLDNGRTVVVPASVVLPGYTALPEMVHVEPVRADGGTSEVRFLFDDPARLVGDAAELFTLTTYDAQGSHIATAVRQHDERSVVASFGTPQRPVGEAELREVSYATAFAGALRDPQGRPTPTGTAHLNPRTDSSQAYAGPTWAADLLSVSTVDGDDVEFVFDRPLDVTAARELAYDVVLADATGRRCARPDPAPVRRVVVRCDGVAGQDVARGVVSAPGYGYDDPVAADVLTRRPTAAPDVTAVEHGPAGRLVLVFDEPVDVTSVERVLLHGPHPPLRGTGAAAAVDPADPRRVVVEVRGEGLVHASLLTVRSGAVTSRATGRHNVFEQLALTPLEPRVLAAGRTVMPDLVSITVDDAGAHHDYDDALPVTAEGRAAVEDLRLYLPDGTSLVCAGAEPPVAGPEGDRLTCRDYRVEDADGPPAEPAQLRAAVHGTASYDTPPSARVVEGAVR